MELNTKLIIDELMKQVREEIIINQGFLPLAVED
jgi:hypothetical protein